MVFDIAGKRARITAMEAEQGGDQFWSDPDAAQKHAKKLSQLRRLVDPWDDLAQRLDDVRELIDLSSADGDDADVAAEIEGELAAAESALAERRAERLFSGPYDEKEAYVSLHSRAGGLDAQDWAEMLSRMYLRWAEQAGFDVEVIEYTPADGAGIKSALLKVSAPRAYGWLRGEAGVHRLVRIGPFDANRRRHTAFALVEVLPVLDDTIEVKIDPADLEVETYRSSGAGGQHVNKTDSAVRITHTPTGTVVQCQNERSQHRNRESAMAVLRSRLFDLEERKRREERAQLRGAHSEESWGHQIRSYVLVPYTLVKDLRTEHETGNVQAVLDGDLDSFLRAFLEWDSMHSGGAE